MASGPLFLVENFFNVTIFPDHVIAANEEATDHEAFRVGTGRRSHRNRWMPTTENSEAWIKVTCDRQRSADCIALDRDHNLDGETVKLEGSNDDFTTSEEIFSVTLPSSVFSPGSVDRSSGVKTEEGAWLIRFDLRTYKYWRLLIPAMGAGTKPEIVGLYLGQSWQPEFQEARPYFPGGRELIVETTRSDTAWVGASRPAQRYSTDITLKLEDDDEHDLARYHIETLAWRYRPVWYVPDVDQAERAWLGQVPSGSYRFEKARGWGFFQSTFPLVETAPKLVGGVG